MKLNTAFLDRPLAQRWTGFQTSVFTEVTALAHQLGAVNLAQGFPDFPGPDRFRELMIQSVTTSHMQYAPSAGDLTLRQGLSSWILKSTGCYFDPQTEITTTCGATEAIYCAVNAFVNPGDRVGMFEPFFDCYAQAVAQAGGVLVPIRLHAPDTPLGTAGKGWTPDWEDFDAVCAGGLKLFVFNSPHNPTGKVFDHNEMERLAKGLEKSGALVVTDEVYESLTYDGLSHVSLVSFEKLRPRVLRISSAAKSFGFTGIKIGWITASPELTQAVRLVHQATIFCTPPAFQDALSELLKDLDWVCSFIESQKKAYQLKRDMLASNLERAGFRVQNAQGAYFLMASYEQLAGDQPDVSFAKQLMETHRVATIPPSVFYLKAPKSLPWLRFAFCKSDATLQLAFTQLLR
jgi:aspartate/methionine/tyrosine aminotransferase